MEKKQYTKPTIEVMKVKVERGFAGSGVTSPSNIQCESVNQEDALFF